MKFDRTQNSSDLNISPYISYKRTDIVFHSPLYGSKSKSTANEKLCFLPYSRQKMSTSDSLKAQHSEASKISQKGAVTIGWLGVIMGGPTGSC